MFYRPNQYCPRPIVWSLFCKGGAVALSPRGGVIAISMTGRMHETSAILLNGSNDCEHAAWKSAKMRKIEKHTLPFLTRPAFKLLDGLVIGSLDITLPDGQKIPVETEKPGPHGVLVIRRWRFFPRVAFRGDVGLGEAFMDGDFETPDLAKLLEVFAANAVENGASYAPSRWAGIALWFRHFLNRNTRSGSKRNILAHYDLGNEFYAEWLDPSMTYSSALFGRGANDLETAQADKYRALIERTRIDESCHVLEIGCGWGGFACLAAQETGCRVTGLTLSPSQKAFAEARIAERGLSDRINIELCDYRDKEGSFDRIVSIEMFEAVGEEYWSTYFNKVRDLLKPGGFAGLQIITLRDAFFDSYRKGADFLQTYIFPGGMLPPENQLPELGRAAGLEPEAPFTFGEDYGRTLAAWANRFEAAWSRIEPKGFDERFRRMWLFYLAICEAGFRSGLINVQQAAYRRV